VTVSVSVTVSVFSILWPSCVLHKKSEKQKKQKEIEEKQIKEAEK